MQRVYILEKEAWGSWRECQWTGRNYASKREKEHKEKMPEKLTNYCKDEILEVVTRVAGSEIIS